MWATQKRLEEKGFTVDSGNKSPTGWWLTAYNRSMNPAVLGCNLTAAETGVTLRKRQRPHDQKHSTHGEMHRTVADAVQRLLARLVFANSGARLAFALCKAVAYPAPERFDFLCRSTFAGVLGDAEARSHCILKIDTRGDHRG